MQIQTPDWVKHAVFYQIFPDRFAKSKQPRKRLLQNFLWEEWHEIPTLQGYKGGDLWGVMEQLDYLQDIGINAIYFTPIFQSASNHRYHTHDYYQVDPMLGGNAAFKDLLDAAHDRNIENCFRMLIVRPFILPIATHLFHLGVSYHPSLAVIDT